MNSCAGDRHPSIPTHRRLAGRTDDFDGLIAGERTQHLHSGAQLNSAHNASAKTMSKAFEAAYAAILGPPANPAPEPKMTMPPRPRSTIGGAKW